MRGAERGGAGCSKSAGIPLAGEIVADIRSCSAYGYAYDKAEKKTYAGCMGNLTPKERHALIAAYIEDAKINWAHIALAQMMKAGFVHRILTTNFDPLMARACGLVQGVFPAVYDLAACPRFRPSMVHDRAVFHLHGQWDGFFQFHDSFAELKEVLRDLFLDTARNHTWIVIGYSGENDPVFEQLAALPDFDHRLYWIDFESREPAPHIRSEILKAGKAAHWIGGQDADQFLFGLARDLGCMPPVLFDRPFTHLLEVMDSIATFVQPGTDTEIPWAVQAKDCIKEVAGRAEPLAGGSCGRGGAAEGAAPSETAEPTAESEEAIQLDLMSGRYDEAVAKVESLPLPLPADLIDLAAWAYFGAGTKRLTEAKTKSGAEADRLLTEAGEKYRQALALKPDDHQALTNWGTALYDQARTRTGAEADRLLTEAGEKCRKAEELKPGSGAYNLACVAGLRGKEEECRHWLGECRRHGKLPKRSHLETDSDLDSVRDKDWFKDILAAAPEG